MIPLPPRGLHNKARCIRRHRLGLVDIRANWVAIASNWSASLPRPQLESRDARSGKGATLVEPARNVVESGPVLANIEHLGRSGPNFDIG